MKDDVREDIETVLRLPVIETMLEVCCRTTGMGFAAVARVTEDQWIACQVRDEIGFGLKPYGELKVETTICNEIRQHGSEVVIDHVATDNVFCGHPTPSMYGFQSYISVPIFLPERGFFGTLCSIDPKPARLRTPQVIGMFKLFAQLIAFHLDAQERLTTTTATLLDERRTAELREQFIAVLGHDLRNPLAAISGGAELLGRMAMPDKAMPVLGMVQNSIKRMARLIDNTLDFARGRLGGGLSIDRAPCHIERVLNEVVDELRSAQPERQIVTLFDTSAAVDCDGGRLAQLASNLLANALTHGAASTPVRLVAKSDADGFELSVINNGPPILAAAMDRLFKPFARGATHSGQQGLGLGLYIASEIARAHGGSLSAFSTSEETRFTFRMPPRSVAIILP